MHKLLSICIPTYNRRKYLEKLILSITEIEFFEYIELIVVIDGSNDGTREFLEDLKSPISIKSIFQENTGRAMALHKSLTLASGKFTMIMDDEDYFNPNSFAIIFKNIDDFNSTNTKARPLCGFCFLCSDESGNILGNEFKDSGMRSNFIKINADHNNRGDNKQIVLTEIIMKNLYLPTVDRRVSTYLIWAKIALKYDAIFLNNIVAVKLYLNEGLSNNIDSVRKKYPDSSKEVYKVIVESSKHIFESKSYRLRQSANFYRYSFHSVQKKENLNVSNIIKIFAYPIGLALYLKDQFTA